MKIVIVGGGTAGWAAASILLKFTKNNDVTVVESTKHPIIGAGEGATGSLPWLITDNAFAPWPGNSVREFDFIKKTKGTVKLGIRLKNWKGDGKHYYSPFHASPTDNWPVDVAFLASILKYGEGKGDMSSMHRNILEDGLVGFGIRNGQLEKAFDRYSYHFDGHEVGKYFKNICTQYGIKHIDSEVLDVSFDENEFVKSIKLDNGSELEADLFIDCSGFARVIMSKTKNRWISFKDELPTNTAIPFSTPIFSKTYRPETLAHAMDSGWMWRIPLQERYGNGYVYCDEFISQEKAIEEASKVLNEKVEPIRTIKFEAGRYEDIWYKNVVSIGLASHFLEPLQATSIHIAIVSMTNLVFHFLKGKDCIKFEKNRLKYNEATAEMIDDYKDLIQMHYLTGRQDTPFWKFISNELKISDKNKHYFDLSKNRLINMMDVGRTHGTPGWPIWCHILDNAGLYKKDMIERELAVHGFKDVGMDELRRVLSLYNTKIKPQLMTSADFFKYLKA